ncbi:MAG TPA: helix-turn-helix domain-containing protein [Acetobacteraceae bacterium]|nr:helix-turn-helix domain-containing protein [Acetobacteraceae bacterium]
MMHAALQSRQTQTTVVVGRPASPDALDVLEQFGTTVRAEREQEVFAQADAAEYCWRVVSGCVRTVKLMEDGRRAVGEFLLAGDYFGFDDIGTYDLSAEAVSNVVLRRYPRRMVESLAERHSGLAQRLRTMALTNLRTAHDRALSLGRKTAVERIAAFLLEMERRSAPQDGPVLELPMCRTDIADHLGLTVETVCRTLAFLKREGMIAITRTGVQLLSRQGLAEVACEARH